MVFGKYSMELRDAVRSGSTREVRAICKKQPSAVNDVDEMGLAPLVWACRGSNVEIVKALVDAGADPKAKAQGHGFQPIHMAAQEGRTAIVEYLLGLGCDVNVPGGDDRNTPLHFAAREGRLATCKMLLDAGAHINALCKGGYTPLLLACVSGNAQVVRLLLSKGADARIANEYGANGLHYAAQKGDSLIAEALLNAGADPNARSVRGEVPLQIANRTGNRDLVTMLLKAAIREETHGDALVKSLAPSKSESASVIVDAAKALGVLSDQTSFDKALNSLAVATARFLLRILEERSTDRGMNLTLLRSAFRYASAKGFEAEWRWRVSGMKEPDLLYSEEDLLQGRAGVDVPDEVAKVISTYIPIASDELFYIYQKWLVAKIKGQQDSTFNIQEETLVALTWVGVTAQTVAHDRFR